MLTYAPTNTTINTHSHITPTQANITNNNTMMMNPTANPCDHPILYDGVCAICNQELVDDESSGVALDYLTKGMRLSNQELARFKQIELNKLIQKRKLCLVLDLDNTLVHTKRIDVLCPEEEYLMESDTRNGDLLLWGSMITKLRPYVREFLEEANKYFDLYIYTLGDRKYASRMARFLDPKNVYFNVKVISKEDCTTRHQKCLDVVPVDESIVLIVDDNASVWKKDSCNLVMAEKYTYFALRGNVNGHESTSYSELRIDESGAYAGLRSTLEVLKRIHSVFYSESNWLYRDVRCLVGFLRSFVLKRCVIVLGKGVMTSTGNSQLWRMAEEMGATCLAECSSTSVTHVVSPDVSSIEAQWAEAEGKFLVNPNWITKAYCVWKRQPEVEFKVRQMVSFEGQVQNTLSDLASFGGLGKRLRCDDQLIVQSLEKRQRSLNIVL